MSQSFEKMAKYIKGNKESKCVMKNLKNFVLNENLPTYNYEEYLEVLHKEVERAAREEGLKADLEEGKKEKTIEIVKKLKDQNIPLEIISISSGLSIEEVEKI